MAISALDKIRAIREKAEKEIEAIKDEARSELSKRIGEAREHLKSLEAEYAELIGRNVRGDRVRKSTGGASVKADVGDEKELESLLKRAPDQSLNRKGLNDLGYNLRSAKVIAKNNPKKFKVVEKGPQATISLIK